MTDGAPPRSAQFLAARAATLDQVRGAGCDAGLALAVVGLLRIGEVQKVPRTLRAWLTRRFVRTTLNVERQCHKEQRTVGLKRVAGSGVCSAAGEE